MALNINIRDLDGALKKIKDVPANAEKFINQEFRAFGADVVSNAKVLAPVDEGFLKNSISAANENLKVTIVVNAVYAAYQEFGTKAFAAEYVASLPPTWQEFAATFQGGSEGFKGFFTAIMEWVKRKGIDEKAAYPIARSILQKGVRPHPFLIPAFEKGKIALLENIKSQLNA